MIKEVLDLLEIMKHTDGETENIRIAKGRDKLPETFKEAWEQFKKESRWRKKNNNK